MCFTLCATIFQAMNNQHLCNRPITVSYAYKKDTKGERHGTPAGIVFSYFFFPSICVPCPLRHTDVNIHLNILN